MAEVIPLDPSEASLARSRRALMDGQLVAFRTDTLYGVSADARNPTAMARLRDLKGRDAGRGFVSLADSFERALQFSAGFPDGARDLAAHFWPGPVTLILRASETLPEGCRQDDGSWAVRVPRAAWCRALAAALGGVIPSSSANLPGSPPARGAAEAAEGLGFAVSLVVDGGVVPADAPASALVDLRGDEALVIRPGGGQVDAWLRSRGSGGQSVSQS